jgi:hypothetical protein
VNFTKPLVMPFLMPVSAIVSLVWSAC